MTNDVVIKILAACHELEARLMVLLEKPPEKIVVEVDHVTYYQLAGLQWPRRAIQDGDRIMLEGEICGLSIEIQRKKTEHEDNDA